MLDFSNGCMEKETLVVYSQFISNPHCHLVQMSSDDDVEVVSVGFMHYGVDFMVHFDTSTSVGEVWSLAEDYADEGKTGYVPYGMIEVDQLVALLDKLPHIDNFLVENAEVLH